MAKTNARRAAAPQAPTAQAAAPAPQGAATPQAPAASPMPTAATLPPASVAAATAPLPTVVSVAGLHVAAARNVVARAATLGNMPTALQGVALVAGKPCRVRVPYTLQCWAAVQATLAANGGAATGQALAQASTGDFVRYAVAHKWLVPAPAPATPQA